MLLRCIDTVSEWTGKLCAWSLFAVGCFITYEVVMRYVFNAPTIWVDEVSRVLMVWSVYLAAAFALKHKEMVVIELVFRTPGTLGRKLSDSFALVFMFIFAVVSCFYGFELWMKSTLAGHTTDTYLALPKWFTHAPVWLGSGLLVLQGIAELIRVWTAVPNDEEVSGATH
ncbi:MULTISPECIES: TRAP transporter small permease subunit [Marinomonas]|uniref:TRAP transporter small permease protein n=1 Tax=Marinomonas alcarazii TaxID=491949 RepID=A0A318V108_9GAMM|nr:MULTISPECIES: TRAP transporter small permease [Marinomonas]PYF82442.1 TRAP-type mannitol/chloroaromatic compound transport system permease small subunit [Marinomonas alcarazii]